MTISHPVGDNSHVITGCRIHPVLYFELRFPSAVQTDEGRGQELASLVPKQDESGVRPHGPPTQSKTGGRLRLHLRCEVHR